ncbi:MAG: hypothetical protein WBO46_02840 [Caldilineaceae bacterium]
MGFRVITVQSWAENVVTIRPSASGLANVGRGETSLRVYPLDFDTTTHCRGLLNRHWPE